MLLFLIALLIKLGLIVRMIITWHVIVMELNHEVNQCSFTKYITPTHQMQSNGMQIQFRVKSVIPSHVLFLFEAGVIHRQSGTGRQTQKSVPGHNFKYFWVSAAIVWTIYGCDKHHTLRKDEVRPFLAEAMIKCSLYITVEQIDTRLYLSPPGQNGHYCGGRHFPRHFR